MDTFFLREQTLGDLLDDIVARFPDNEAVVHADHNFSRSWAGFSADVDAAAKGLMALGVRKGEKVAIWATNVPDATGTSMGSVIYHIFCLTSTLCRFVFSIRTFDKVLKINRIRGFG